MIPQNPKDNLHLRMEVQAILLKQSRNAKLAAEQALRIINAEAGADYSSLLRYLTGKDLPQDQAKKLWTGIVDYAAELRFRLGDRVSAHIGFYHFSRDEEALKKCDWHEPMPCSPSAQMVAFLEMRGWWERDERTGIHRGDVMRARVERELSACRMKKSFFSLVHVWVPENEHSDKVLEGLSAELMNRTRSSDVVGHWNESTLAVLLPMTPLAGAEVVVRRLCEHISQNESYPPQTKVTLLNAPLDGVKMLAIDTAFGSALRHVGKNNVPWGRPAGSGMAVFSQIKYLLTGGLKKQLRHHPQHFIIVMLLFLAIGGLYSVRAKLWNLQDVWVPAASFEALDGNGTSKDWQTNRGSSSSSSPLVLFSDTMPQMGVLALDSSAGITSVQSHQLPMQIDFEFRLPIDRQLLIQWREANISLRLERDFMKLYQDKQLLASKHIICGRNRNSLHLILDKHAISWKLKKGEMTSWQLPSRLTNRQKLRWSCQGMGAPVLVYNIKVYKWSGDRYLPSQGWVTDRIKDVMGGSVLTPYDIQNLLGDDLEQMTVLSLASPAQKQNLLALSPYLYERAMLSAGYWQEIENASKSLSDKDALLWQWWMERWVVQGDKRAVQYLQSAPNNQVSAAIQKVLTFKNLLLSGNAKEINTIWQEIRSDLKNFSKDFLFRLLQNLSQDPPQLIKAGISEDICYELLRNWEDDPELVYQMVWRLFSFMDAEQVENVYRLCKQGWLTNPVGELIFQKVKFKNSSTQELMSSTSYDLLRSRCCLLEEVTMIRIQLLLQAGRISPAQKMLEKLIEKPERPLTIWAEGLLKEIQAGVWSSNTQDNIPTEPNLD